MTTKNIVPESSYNSFGKIKAGKPVLYDTTNGDYCIVNREKVFIIEVQIGRNSFYKGMLDWSIGLFIPTLILLPTVSSYNSFLGISGATWNAIVVILMASSFVASMFSGYKLWNTKNFSLIDELFNQGNRMK